MQITIYAGEKPIYLSDKPNDFLKNLSLQDDVIFSDNENDINVRTLVDELEDKKNSAAVVTGKNAEALKKIFLNAFETIEAAGGIVQNEQKDILFIFRRGKWDLPKGKMETGESPEICAEREIEEETGVNNLTLKRKIGETYHLYRENNKIILKISRWFYFTCHTKQELRPQPEEDITEVKFIKTRLITEPMLNTYKTIRDIMTAFFDTP